MAVKDILGGAGSGGIGTKIAEYSERGPFHCEDCIYLKTPGPDKEHGLCKEKHMLKDPEVKTDKKSGLKIVNIELGCCRYVRPPKGKKNETE